jgi:hypothetical protein
MNEPLPPEDQHLADLLRRAGQDEAAPAEVLARVVALRGSAQRLAGRASTLLRRVIAVAMPGGGASGFTPAFGVRGGVPAGQQWLFKSDECEIDLRTARQGERWAVAGQLFGALGAQRVLLEGGSRPLTAELGSTREFNFADLAPGRYRLTVQAGNCEVVIPQFDVGSVDPA